MRRLIWRIIKWTALRTFFSWDSSILFLECVCNFQLVPKRECACVEMRNSLFFIFAWAVMHMYVYVTLNSQRKCLHLCRFCLFVCFILFHGFTAQSTLLRSCQASQLTFYTVPGQAQSSLLSTHNFASNWQLPFLNQWMEVVMNVGARKLNGETRTLKAKHYCNIPLFNFEFLSLFNK